MKSVIAVFTAIITFISGVWGAGIEFFNHYQFTVDTANVGETVVNPVSNVNVWSIQGNPFVGEQVNEKYNIFEFVDYVQFMQCTGGNADRDLFKDPYDKTVLDDYDFTVLIENCRGVLELGAKPMLKLGSVPMKYSKNAEAGKDFGTNIYPPDDYDVYYNYIAAIAQALVDEFGVEEVLTWRYGVMTEFENSQWFMANSQNPEDAAMEYCKLYDYTVQALIDVIGEDVFVGAHAMAVTEGHWDERIFINHCANGTNYKTGEKGSRICYLAASFYDYSPGEETSGMSFEKTIKHLKKAADKAGLENLIFGVDEGRLLVGNSSGENDNQLLTRTVGYTYQGAYDARLYRTMFNNNINYFSAWSYLSNGLIDGHPTVSYHVARNAAGFDGAKLVKTRKLSRALLPNIEVDAVSAYNEKTETVHIMAYNYKNDVDYNRTATLDFKVKVPQFDGQRVKVTAYVIDNSCNYFDEWQEDRVKYNITDDCFNWSPDDPQIENPTTLEDGWARDIYFNELKSKYEECSKLEPVTQELEVENGKVKLDITLNPNAVVFYEITPVK
ncbi:MAG: hypothetical protein IKT61_00660 [Clostridia bacterium]|nr:hypothetical protein [Clostridia bacterium]